MDGVATHSELNLEGENARLTGLSAEDRVRWAVETFGSQAVLLSSMQKTASVLMHMVHRFGNGTEILFGDTGFHFHQTLRFRDDFIRKYGVNVVTLYPELTPEEQEAKFGRKLHLFLDGQPECCRLRKEEPFLQYVRGNGKRLVMNGLRKVEGGRRGNNQVLIRDPRIQGFVLHPILEWNDDDVDEYLKRHEVPVHPLHALGYPSIGCACCTTPVQPGEDPRAGRWRHLRPEGSQGPQYCGINFTDGSGI